MTGTLTLSCDLAGATLEDVKSVDPPGDIPEGWEFPLGCYEFKITGLAPGAEVTVFIQIHSDTDPESYFKHGPTPDDATMHWYEFLNDGLTGAFIDGKKVELEFVDGERGDDDLAPNGEIIDQGGPVVAGPDACRNRR